jgi:hypothetical protein
MRVVGVDLAAESKATGAVVLEAIDETNWRRSTVGAAHGRWRSCSLLARLT